jgi:hypothetical protein
MARWAAEREPWVHHYAQYDWSDGWSPVNVTADGGVTTVALV